MIGILSLQNNLVIIYSVQVQLLAPLLYRRSDGTISALLRLVIADDVGKKASSRYSKPSLLECAQDRTNLRTYTGIRKRCSNAKLLPVGLRSIFLFTGVI